jgi:hypothetical protein
MGPAPMQRMLRTASIGHLPEVLGLGICHEGHNVTDLRRRPVRQTEPRHLVSHSLKTLAGSHSITMLQCLRFTELQVQINNTDCGISRCGTDLQRESYHQTLTTCS